ncbi:NADH-quinone oxidoreductase subunit E [Sinorhizobium kostiense]|uniref:NADH-quinone oxidoreductase subunit E n=1 Tax=Sinorhizobium kostiense TaxID=76747 RepID=A0ABS4QW18_9HYPH|nr:NADH:ubiquinone oxidoreductase [Sinorhizobium kostiense]MBP2234845.1 NADH-quinone oxidoreductase subunit E [Sinorhizobium kostiense]
MAGERKEGQGREVVTVIPFARVADANPADPFAVAEWVKKIPNASLHPMMAHPAAAVATATALGFGLTSHIAGIMFGVMQGAASVLQKTVVERVPPRPAEPSAASPAKPAEAKASPAPVSPVTTPKPKAATKPAAPAPAKPAEAKASPAPAAPVSAPKPKAATKPAASAPAKPAEAKASPAPVAPVTARKPKAARKPAASAPRSNPSDDLKRISGVGPKLEQVLNGRGIRRLADVAALSAADVARLDAELGLEGRIARDDWVGQAKALIGKK